MDNSTIMTLIVVGVPVVIFICWWVSIFNREIRLRNLTESHKKICEANFDKMWKVIKQITDTSEKYRETFKEIYPDIIRGRYEKDTNGLFKAIHEMNPDFNIGLMSQLATAIEVNREEFFSCQKALISCRNEHKNLIENIPGCFFLPGKQPVEITVITSDHTESVYKSGKENI